MVIKECDSWCEAEPVTELSLFNVIRDPATLVVKDVCCQLAEEEQYRKPEHKPGWLRTHRQVERKCQDTAAEEDQRADHLGGAPAPVCTDNCLVVAYLEPGHQRRAGDDCANSKRLVSDEWHNGRHDEEADAGLVDYAGCGIFRYRVVPGTHAVQVELCQEEAVHFGTGIAGRYCSEPKQASRGCHRLVVPDDERMPWSPRNVVAYRFPECVGPGKCCKPYIVTHHALLSTG